MDKTEIRELIRSARSELLPKWITEQSILLQERLLSSEAFERAESVSCYIGLGGEVRTEMIFDCCFEQGKRVCVPAYCAELDGYELAVVTEDSELTAGPMNVPEPLKPEWLKEEDVDLALVPGLAFDRSGGRVGHGGGHYDRLLGDTNALIAGLCFEFQVRDHVPVDEHDVLMNMIITEAAVYNCG